VRTTDNLGKLELKLEELEADLNRVKEKPDVCELSIKEKVAMFEKQLFVINIKLKPYRRHLPSHFKNAK